MSEARARTPWELRTPQQMRRDNTKRTAALRAAGLPEYQVKRVAGQWPAHTQTEDITCHVCDRHLYDDESRAVETHRLALIGDEPRDGVYVICADCLSPPQPWRQRLTRWLRSTG